MLYGNSLYLFFFEWSIVDSTWKMVGMRGHPWSSAECIYGKIKMYAESCMLNVGLFLIRLFVQFSSSLMNKRNNSAEKKSARRMNQSLGCGDTLFPCGCVCMWVGEGLLNRRRVCQHNIKFTKQREKNKCYSAGGGTTDDWRTHPHSQYFSSFRISLSFFYFRFFFGTILSPTQND